MALHSIRTFAPGLSCAHEWKPLGRQQLRNLDHPTGGSEICGRCGATIIRSSRTGKIVKFNAGSDLARGF